MQITFSFNEFFEPCGQIVVAGDERAEAQLRELARKMLLAALSQQTIEKDTL